MIQEIDRVCNEIKVLPDEIIWESCPQLLFQNFYLLNFAIILYLQQGYHNSITPITVDPLDRFDIQHKLIFEELKTEIKQNGNSEKSFEI